MEPNRTALSGIGGRKFAAFFVASLALVALYAFGIELNDQTLDAITAMYLAFAGGNGLEHIATQLGQRVGKPDALQLPEDIARAVREAIASGGTVETRTGDGTSSGVFAPSPD